MKHSGITANQSAKSNQRQTPNQSAASVTCIDDKDVYLWPIEPQLNIPHYILYTSV